MSSTPASLTLLPPEILKRIASYATCETVLSLIQCSKALYHSCHDAHVYKSILMSHGNHPTFTEPWDISFLPGNAPTSAFARFALADSKARKLAAISYPKVHLGSGAISTAPNTEEKKEQTVQNSMSIPPVSALQYLPLLAAHDHPFTKSLPISHMIRLSAPPSHDSTYTARVNFVLTALVLAQHRSGTNHVDRNEFSGLRNVIDKSLIYSGPAPDPLCVVLAFLQCRLRHPRRLNVPLPSISKIPFREIMTLPLPFKAMGDAFSSLHLPVSTSKAFLETGTWAGYYSYGSSHQSNFDPPMRNICFTVLEEADGAMHVSSPGVDNVGHFTLDGTVLPNGTLGIVKTYSAGFGWDWIGRMTPWGILGFWGMAGDHSGWFWLWKNQWVD